MKGVKMGKGYAYSLLLLAVTALLFAANLFWGAVDIPYGAVIDILSGHETDHQSWEYIIWESRLPQCVTALLCGAALSVSGLMLQTVFYNPLADSSILGISSGSSLGVAIVMLIGGGSLFSGDFVLSGFWALVVSAFLGAVVVIAILLSLSALIKNSVMLLIAGIMIGYVVSSVISLMNFFSTDEGVHSFVMWGLGNFSGVSLSRLPWFSGLICVGLLFSL